MLNPIPKGRTEMERVRRFEATEMSKTEIEDTTRPNVNSLGLLM
jgi:hypothetical protein